MNALTAIQAKQKLDNLMEQVILDAEPNYYLQRQRQ